MKSTRKKSIRLSPYIIPLKYTLKLKPDLQTFTFEGEEVIRLQVGKDTKKITLHSKELDIEAAEMLQGKNKNFALIITYDERAETATFVFPKKIRKGVVDLRIVFKGILNDKMRGFYKSRYEANGEMRHMATTQFEATDARRAFPCFDEPAMKSIFHVTLVIPKDKTAISNTIPSEIREHGDGWKSVIFAPTPRMSTYLLAFIAGDFERMEKKTKEGVLVRVFVTPGKIHQAEFALSCAVKTLSFFSAYFKIPYPLPVLDIIAAPDFAAGAMENWGAITFRESALLVDPKHSSASNKQWVALVVAHELAHQWFGNLVTMEWWTHLWLNEGFATYIEYLAVNHLFPEWDVWTQFVNQESSVARELDGLFHTHPIEVNVHHPDEIDEVFDKVSYAKGASVIRMLAEYLGERDFRNGLRYYLKKHSYSNTSTVHLWNAFEQVSGKPVGAIMKNWTKQPGFPFLTLSETPKGLLLRQDRFFLNPRSESRTRERTLWTIPITINTNVKKKNILMKHRIVRLPKTNTPWLKINADESGFFATRYPTNFLAALEEPIRSRQLDVLDRLGIIRDTATLAHAGKYTSEDVMKIAVQYRHETDYTVWLEVISALNKIAALFSKESFKKDLDRFIRELLAVAVERIGWEKKPDERHTDSLLRELLLLHAGIYGDTETIARAKKLFTKTDERDNAIHPDLRNVVYGVVARHGGAKEHAKFIRMHTHAKLHEEKNRIGAALAMFDNAALLKKTLAFSLSSLVRPQDTTGILVRVAANPKGQTLVWNFTKANWDILLDRYGGGFHLSKIVGSFGASTSQKTAKDMKKFFISHAAPAAERAIKQAIETIESNATRYSRERRKLGKAFTRESLLLFSSRAPHTNRGPSKEV